MPSNHAGRLLRSDGGSRSFLASDIEYRQELYDRNHGVLRTPRPSARSFSIRSVTSQVCSLGSVAMILGVGVVCFLSYQMTLGMLTDSALGVNHFIIDALKDQSGTLAKIFQSHSDAAVSTEAQVMGQYEQSHIAIYNETYCSPTAVNITQLNDNAFNTKLRNASQLPPPVFPSSLKLFCADAETARQYQWEYCLPVAADRTDEPHCQHADRLDFLRGQQPTESFCTASVLHLLLLDAYDVLNQSGAKPTLIGNTLSGAVRNGSITPSATAAKLGFQSHQVATDVLRHELNARGYHLFYDSVWRICVAPTHPLASKLYRDTRQQPTANASTLHVDLLRMEPMAAETGGSQWFVDSAQGRRVVQQHVLLPYQQAPINGVLFDAIADATAFLT